MAVTKSKNKTTITAKKATQKTDELVEVITEPKKLTAEEKIFGAQEVVETKIIKSYEDSSIRYKITNLQVKNKPVIVSGDLVESFIGCKNIDARNALKSGANKVITKDFYGKDIYKIEVVE
jgi:hypothetical protein